ncbi:hypothetical protein GPALN_005495 [Globodera pallida]|nr:hypothetical protein GPALN_005495 [Globodera pallida]
MSSTKRTCLICKRDYPKNSLIAHIAEHLNYKRHKCSDCTFQSVLMEAMVDHQNNTTHKVEFDVKNWYLERVCQLVYSDFEYAQKNGEDAIRKFGSSFGDKTRLTEMLRVGEVKEEEDEIEVIGTREAAAVSIPFARRSLSESTEQQPSPTSVKTQSQSHATPNQSQVSGCVQRQQIVHTVRASNRNIVSQQEIEIVRPKDAFNVQTAPADSSNEHPKQGQPTEQILVELHRQITKGLERKICKICHLMVDNDYKSQKEHVIGRHMVGIDENKREEKLRWKLERCFKQEGHLLITNDFQCNICGHETKYKETRYHHVSAVHTDYQWNCVFPSCDFVVRSKRHFNGHLNSWHELNLSQLEGEAKDSFIMMNSDFELKLTPLVRKCFPFDLPSPNSGGEEERKKKTRKKSGGGMGTEDALVDNVVSNFMPTLGHSTLNRPSSNQARTHQNGEMDEYESSSGSDYTDSEHESKSTKHSSSKGNKERVELKQNSSIAKQQTKRELDIEKTRNTPSCSTPTSAAISDARNGSFYSCPKNIHRTRPRRMSEHRNNYHNDSRWRRVRRGFNEASSKGQRHAVKKQKMEENSDSIVYLHR